MLGHRPLNVEDYLFILKRHWWVIAIPTVVLPIVAVVATLYIPAQYVSQSSVQIGQQKVSNDLVKQVVTEDINSRLATIDQQIESRSSILPIVDKFNLYADQRLTTDDRIALARKNIDIQALPTGFAHSNGVPGFTIAFTASDAHTAQMVCAEITSLFISANLHAQQDFTGDTTDFLKEQLDNAKHTLDDQEAKKADFERKYFGMRPEDEGQNINILNSLNTQLDASTQDLSRMEQNKTYLETTLAAQLAATPASVSPQTQEQQLQALLAQRDNLTQHYSAQYPDVIAINRRIADLQAKIAHPSSAQPSPAAPATPGGNDSLAVQDLRARIRAADLGIQQKRAEQAQINKQIRDYQARIQSTPQVEEEYEQLTRDSQTSQALYDSDLAKLNQAQQATDLQNRQEGETFSVLDAANLPDNPTYPKRKVFASGGLAGGVALGLLIVALLEYRDTALRTERDVWAFTKLPTLAVIAWSGDVAERKPGKFARLKRPFRRKPKEPVAEAQG
ncbi:MAG: lipopolysaccharide biosynthesis protein [Acidobacteriaceae bacterium]|jgi:polysaccharide chain length determinant protein (PEP-CTERM system associated)